MTTIVELRQRLELDASWRVLKWDASDEFIRGLQPTLHQLKGGVSAADVVGIRSVPRRERTLLIVEFKDFDHPNIPADQRQQAAVDAVSDPLMGNIVRKVVDTLAGATFAHDAQQRRCEELSGSPGRRPCDDDHADLALHRSASEPGHHRSRLDEDAPAAATVARTAGAGARDE